MVPKAWQMTYPVHVHVMYTYVFRLSIWHFIVKIWSFEPTSEKICTCNVLYSNHGGIKWLDLGIERSKVKGAVLPVSLWSVCVWSSLVIKFGNLRGQQSKVTGSSDIITSYLCIFYCSPSSVIVICLIIAGIFWLHRLLRVLYNAFHFWEIRAFYTRALKIPSVSITCSDYSMYSSLSLSVTAQKAFCAWCLQQSLSWLLLIIITCLLTCNGCFLAPCRKTWWISHGMMSSRGYSKSRESKECVYTRQSWQS